ncbi:MAG: Gfo/Idh/MocA family oxidoreductase [Anaerolineales bacterium]|nr:Gfo/Idh/MocA family oxidoreductase [Anaerolineales bacterium]
MSKKLRVGVLGMTHDHLWWWLPNLLKSPLGDLVAGAEPHEELRIRIQKEFECPKVYDTYEGMLEEEELDAVWIYCDHVTKAQLAVKAAERGLHIMTEKTMAVNVKDARMMLAAVRDAGVQLMVNWPFFWDMPAMQHSLQIALSGDLGRIWCVKFRGAHGGPIEYGHSRFFADWLFNEKLSGGGAIIDYGGYGATLARHLLGQPSRVMAMAGHLVKDYVELDDNAMFMMQYPRAMALMECSWTQAGMATSYVTSIYGTEATLVTSPFMEKILIADSENPHGIEIEPQVPTGDLENESMYFLSRIQKELPVEGMCSPEQSLDAQEIVEAAIISAQTGQAVSLPLPMPYMRGEVI